MKKLFYLIVVLIFFVSCSGTGGSGDSSSNSEEKILFAIYMAGSDLETMGNIGSGDLYESIQGFNELSDSQKENIDLKVAFGGSKATNWRGVKYADRSCLSEDIENQKFGDDDCYSHKDETANMGDADTLTNFLTTLNIEDILNNYDKKIFIFWNHGGAYEGVCYDENHNNDKLTLDEIQTSFNAIGIEFDIIGMDACLMGNLEVAKSVRNYGNYLIASEELEPGHGWDYKDLISWIGKNSAESLENFGKKFVDSFLDSQSHSATKDKTLSVIDLTKIESFMSSFNKLFNSLDGDSDFNYILSASKDSQKYAVDEKNNMADGRTLDLKTFLQNIKSNRSDLSSQIDELNSKIDDFVVYNRYQESKVNSNGISIFQPLNTPYWSTLYKNNEDFVSTEWFSFVGDFLTKGLDDTQDPVISSETSCTNNSKDGYCLDVSDNIGIKSAMDYNLLVYGDKYLILGANKLEKTEDNKYFQPKTDDIWLYFCDGDNYSKCIIPSAFYLQDYDNKYLYYSYGEVNSKLSQFFIEIDNTAGEISHWSVEIGDNNVSSKQQHTIEKGDTLKFYYYVVDSDGNGDWTAGDEIDFINDPNTVISNLGATVYYYSFFTDFKGNGVSGTIHNTSE